ncbi:CBS domain-containing protein [Tropicibacter oceani]|uniref:CBS domain-containing protein n=1 Tax=Tropicibacter oceani TaxID=3058420 RepID=A0ABY8QJW2_9RHOB|nr:CBS domain-containing protein [Tropicibacter oceani]WGW04321.1 CBS domain-containing protein [Tropicibacter oceani]
MSPPGPDRKAGFELGACSGDGPPEPNMTVSSIMQKPAVTIATNATLCAAAQKMRDENVGLLPVLENDHLVGVITDRDIVVRCLAAQLSARQCCVRDVMTCNILSCRDTDPIEAAAARMGDNQFRRLPVHDANQVLVGVLSVDDIAEHYSERLAGETLGEIVEARGTWL